MEIKNNVIDFKKVKNKRKSSSIFSLLVKLIDKKIDIEEGIIKKNKKRAST